MALSTERLNIKVMLRSITKIMMVIKSLLNFAYNALEITSGRKFFSPDGVTNSVVGFTLLWVCLPVFLSALINPVSVFPLPFLYLCFDALFVLLIVFLMPFRSRFLVFLVRGFSLFSDYFFVSFVPFFCLSLGTGSAPRVKTIRKTDVFIEFTKRLIDFAKRATLFVHCNLLKKQNATALLLPFLSKEQAATQSSGTLSANKNCLIPSTF